MTLTATIDANGITAPSYDQILAELVGNFQTIYGADAYIDPDSQDGQMLAIMARAIHDSNQTAISLYNSMAPTFAQGAGLSRLVKINGLARQIASNSTVTVTIVGQVGTVINNGIVADTAGKKWDLPALVTIPIAGQIDVTATAQELGAITAQIGTVTTIFTPTRGWQTVTNAAPADVGAPVELDAQLRARQAISTAFPAQSILQSILAGVASVTGVVRSAAYENDTDVTDANGLPPHSFSIVTDGGAVQDIVDEIGVRKPPGIQTYGDVTGTYTDPIGLQNEINFFQLDEIQIYVAIEIQAFVGYTASIGAAAVQALADFIDGLGIGVDVFQEWCYGPLSPTANVNNSRFAVTSLKIGLAPSPSGTADIPIAFGAVASCTPSNITLVLV